VRPGDIVDPKARSTPTGLPVSWGPSRLVSKIGTVPNFWEFEILADGRRMKGMVYPEDFIKSGGPQISVIDGGKSGS
jgi:hypothetical protein